MEAIPNVPPGVREVVDALVAAARDAFDTDLTSVILYGSAAEGRMRATSDVNLLFVLTRFDETRANAFREAYRVAQAAANVTAMFLLGEEIETASNAFAQKFADIQRRHVVLYGSDPFASMLIPRDAIVLRLQQVLLNLTMRLRETYVERSLRAEQCAVTVAEAAGPLRTSAAAILELEGRGVMAPKEALAALVGELQRPDLTSLLPQLSEAREQRALPSGEAASILYGMLELARALQRRASAL